jgi:antitoxin component of MazEF toxin-antitoxin module
MPDVEVIRIRKLSRSAYIAIPPAILKHLRLNLGDFLALRCVDQKIVMERVPVESIAKLRVQDAEAKAV